MSGNPLSFGDALKACKVGNAVLRTGWAGAGKLTYVAPTYSDPTLMQQDRTFERVKGFTYTTTPGGITSVYIPTQQDEFTADWYVTP